MTDLGVGCLRCWVLKFLFKENKFIAKQKHKFTVSHIFLY